MVIGAGITGLTSAYLLKKAGLKVAVLEKDTVGGGTTGRTTGKVTSQHSLSYAQLQQTVGKTDTQNYANANQAAINQIEKIVKTEKIDCDWERADNYVFTTDSTKVMEFRKEAQTAVQLGLPAKFVKETPLPFAVDAAVAFSNQAKMTAQKYLLGLANAIHDEGCYIFEKSNASRIHDGAPCVVHTNHGKIIAKDCIVATNVPTMPLMARGAYCLLEYPTESYIIAAPFSGTLDGMYISPDKKHYSLLPVNLDGKSYLLVGGGGHLSGLRISKKMRYNRLVTYAEKHFSITKVTHRWADRDYMAYDKIPLIGKLYPWSKHLFVGTAYKKWGLSNGTVAGMILTDLITGRENEWAETFSPQRMRPIKYIPKSVMEQAKQIW